MIAGLSWVEDGLELSEYHAAIGLTHLARTDFGEEVMKQPWVIEGSNHPALRSLGTLARYNLPKLMKIMSHPTMADGISRREAKIAATLHWVGEPGMLEMLLDPEQAIVEERTVTVPLTGETELTIIRTVPGSDDTMESLVRAVRNIEEFIGVPLPVTPVIISFDDSRAVSGIHLRTHISIGVNEQVVDEEFFFDLLAHEASHYHWKNPPTWLGEGAAHFMTVVAGNDLQGPVIQHPCSLARNIAEFESLERMPESVDYVYCPYALGERLFRDLHRNMDETAFRLAFRRLLLHTKFDVPDGCDNHTPTICHVREAFSTYATGDTLDEVEKVIARWYDGTGPYDQSSIEEPVNPDIAAIDGRVENAFLSLTLGGPPVSNISILPGLQKGIWLNLEYTHGSSTDLDSLPIEIVLTYEDGFELQRKKTELQVDAYSRRGTQNVHLIQETTPGRYWVQAYWGEQKIAQAAFDNVPLPVLYHIRGMITDVEGQPLTSAILTARQGVEDFNPSTEFADGSLEIIVPPGSYTVEVSVLVANYYHFVGWYNGNGGLTIDPSQASEVVVDRADVEGVNVALPAGFESLICAQGVDRSRETGRCPGE